MAPAWPASESGDKHQPSTPVAIQPELNPQENIWLYLRLANQVFETYEVIVEAWCHARNGLAAQPERITSIATRTWAEQVILWCRWN
jgi:hypothetical protein